MLALTFAAAIVAESALVRSGLATILAASPAIQVVAEATPREASQLNEAGIDVVVCDVDDTAREELPQTPEGIPVLAVVSDPEQASYLFLRLILACPSPPSPSLRIPTSEAPAVPPGL